jgi:hypothetical protein
MVIHTQTFTVCKRKGESADARKTDWKKENQQKKPDPYHRVFTCRDSARQRVAGSGDQQFLLANTNAKHNRIDFTVILHPMRLTILNQDKAQDNPSGSPGAIA